MIKGVKSIPGKTIHQLNEFQLNDAWRALEHSERIKMATQIRFERVVVRRGWLFHPDYEYRGVKHDALLVCEFGFEFTARPESFSKTKSDSKPKGYWTKERCIHVSKDLRSRHQFAQEQSSAYVISKNKGWLDECCGHMVSMPPVKGETGKYYTPVGAFSSCRAAAKANGITYKTIRTRCKFNVDKPILTGANKGKTWRELGWSFVADC